MSAQNPSLSFLDRLIIQVDQGLRTLVGKNEAEYLRKNPCEDISEDIKEALLTDQERKHSAGLMRINHAGEVCAQALYQGQALTARNLETREKMQEAAREEIDHLFWCESRLKELNSRTSYFDPLWYFGSLTIGIAAGLAGDKWNLGFVAETERQVVKHLSSHLEKLPADDQKSRAIIEQMREDEAKHATMAVDSGAAELPDFIKTIMTRTAKIMTSITYWI